MDNYLDTLLEGLYTRACSKKSFQDEQGILQSVMMKLLSHYNDLDYVLAMKHFLEILDVMHGSSRSVIDMHILNMATRKCHIHDPLTIQLLFQVCQSLHDGLDLVNTKDDENQQPAHLISRFVQMETLVHSSNYLATEALRDGKNHLTFVKSCLAFSEVTIPSIAADVSQLNLYLGTAEIALSGRLISHSDGLIISAMSCIENMNFPSAQHPADIDGLLSSIRKLCSLLVMVPGNSDQGVTKIPFSIVSLINSRSWMTPRMKTIIFCAIILLLSTHSEIPGNDLLYYGDSSYLNETNI